MTNCDYLFINKKELFYIKKYIIQQQSNNKNSKNYSNFKIHCTNV